MKTKDRHCSMWLLCLLLMVALWAVSGCQTQSAREPTSTTLPEPPKVTVEQTQSAQASATSPQAPTVTLEQVQSTQGPTSTTLPEPPRVTVQQVKQWMEAGEPLTFLDSRSAADWSVAKTKVPGAIRVPPDDWESHLSEIPRDRRIIAYCA
jgi:hypothetical protein